MKASSDRSESSTKTPVSLPSIAAKALKLHALNPSAADVIEELIDDVLAKLLGTEP